MIISASTTYVTLCDIIRSFMTLLIILFRQVVNLWSVWVRVCCPCVQRMYAVYRVSSVVSTPCVRVYTLSRMLPVCTACVHHPVFYVASVSSVCTPCVQRVYSVCTHPILYIARVYAVCTACVHTACPLLPVAEHWWRGTHGSGGPRWCSRAHFSPLSPLSSRPSVLLSSVCLLVSSVLCPVICPLCPIFTSPHPSQSSRLNHPLAVHLLHPPPSSVVIPLPPSFFLFIPLSLSPLFLCLPPSFFSSSLFFLLHPSSSILLHLSSSLFLDPPSLSSLLSSLFLLPSLNPRPRPVDRSLWRLCRWEWGPGLR